jgi:hypothetical protein
MPVTINVNRLSLVHEASGGISTATLPNVCATPDVGLVAYPSTAYSRDLAGGTRDVVADGGSSIAVRGSTFAVSSGDEPGTLGGVVSRVNGAESTFLSWSLDVKIEGRNACRLTDKMLHNGGNTLDCGGVVQPVVSGGGKQVELPSARAARVAGYSLEIDVLYQPPPVDVPVTDPPSPPAPPPAPVAVDRVRIQVSRKKDPTIWSGNTHPDKKQKNPVGTWTVKSLKADKYSVRIDHDCLVEADRDQNAGKPEADRKPISGSVSVKGRPTKYETWMIAADLRKAANEKGVVLGARMSTQATLVNLTRQAPTVLSTFNDLAIGTFLASRWPDSLNSSHDLTDLTNPAQAPGFGWGGTQGDLDFAKANHLQIMTTPLVWPMPKCTPDWPCGSPRAHLNAKDEKGQPVPYVPFEQSYVYRRTNRPMSAAEQQAEAARPAAQRAKDLKAREKALREAERKAGMEVHTRFIATVMSQSNLALTERPGLPGVPAPPWHVVVNECLNLRYAGAQPNATSDADFARDHPLWQRFGLWDVEESKDNISRGYPRAIVDHTLWKNIRDCFVAAHAADPNALLILNDYSIEAYHPEADYYGLWKAHHDADVPVRQKRKKAWEAAKRKLVTSERQARKARDAANPKPLPASKYKPNSDFAAALSNAEIAFENAGNDALGAYDLDLQAAEDVSDGAAKQEAHYKSNFTLARDTYGARKATAEKVHADAVAKAVVDRTAAINAANEAAKNALPPAEQAKFQPPIVPGALEGYNAATADATKRHAHAVKCQQAIYRAKVGHWKAYHRAQIQYRRGYTTAKKKAAAAYDHAEKPQLFYRLVEWLVKHADGLPAAVKSKLVIGFQMHYPKNPGASGYAPDAIAANVARYALLHLPVVITELDVSYEGLDAIRTRRQKAKATPGEYEKDPKSQPAFMPLFRVQAERFRALIAACLSSRNCLGITTWGVADYAGKDGNGNDEQFRYMAYWFHPTFTCPIQGCPGNGPPGEYWRKPAYAASVSAFHHAQPQFTDAQIRGGSAAAWVKKHRAKAAKKGKS